MGHDAEQAQEEIKEILQDTLRPNPKPQREPPSEQARELGLLVGWVLEDRFGDAVRFVEYAKRKQIPMKNIVRWLDAKVKRIAYGEVMVEDMHGKKFVISVREVEN